MIPADATVFDVSLPLSPDLIVWPGDPAIAVSPASRISAGSAANVSHLACASHTGTHVDAPWHFVDHGKKLEEIAPERWTGPCWVAAFSDDLARIEPVHLDAAGIPDDTERLLLKTANSRLWHQEPLRFDASYVGLSPEAAQWVVDRGIGLVGSDYLSIEPYQEPGHHTHLTLLGNEVLILEGLNLSDVAQGPYQLLCLPLRLTVGDGAPARALLVRP
jgi:arylformamidase